MNRIVGPDGLIPGQDGQPDRPMTAAERLNHIKELWDKGKTNESIAATVAFLAFLSNGIHGIGQNFRAIENNELGIKKALEEIAANQQLLSSALAAVSLRVQTLEGGEGEEWKRGGK